MLEKNQIYEVEIIDDKIYVKDISIKYTDFL